jgi:hypothetical protein
LRLVPWHHFWEHCIVCHITMPLYLTSSYLPTPSTNWPSRKKTLVRIHPNVALNFRNSGACEKRLCKTCIHLLWNLTQRTLLSQSEDWFPLHCQVLLDWFLM